MKKHAGPIIAAILLLLRVLYVGSYVALVKPTAVFGLQNPCPYRIGGEYAERAFWPLERIDRRVRQDSWLAEAEPSVRY